MNNELYHYGVLGMKWGVRKKRPMSKRGSKNKLSENFHEDYVKAHTRKSIKTMSDRELRERLNRINMEQQYLRLNSRVVDRGSAYVHKIIKAGTTVVSITGTALTIYNNINKIRDIID